MTSNRHDVRRRVVLDEANSIGTCCLRAGLLSEPETGRIRTTLRRFVDVRLEHLEKSQDLNKLGRMSAKMDQLLNTLRSAVEDATK